MSVTSDTIIHLQISPIREGYIFTGWYSEKENGVKIASYADLQINEDTTFYAHWDKVSVNRGNITKLTNMNSQKLKINIGKVSDAKGYELIYADNSRFKNAVKKTLSKTSYTLSNIKKGKNYYIKVRAYKIDSAGKKVYGKYSSIKKVKISS